MGLGPEHFGISPEEVFPGSGGTLGELPDKRLGDDKTGPKYQEPKSFEELTGPMGGFVLEGEED